jgi:hypothetical protein
LINYVNNDSEDELETIKTEEEVETVETEEEM